MKSTTTRRLLVAGLTWMLLLALTHIGTATGTAGPFTQEVVWLWEEKAPAAPMLLAGASTVPVDAEPPVAVVWSEDRSGWFPTHEVQLVVARPDGEKAVYSVLRGGLAPVRRLAVHLSVHPAAGIVSVALYDADESRPLAAHAVHAELPAGPWHPADLSPASGPKLLASSVQRGYRPVATRFDVGERTGQAALIPVATFQAGSTATVRIESLVPPPGSYRLQVLRPSAAGEQVVLSIEIEPEERNWVDLPLDSLAPGPFALVLDYIEDGEVTWTERRAVRLGKAELHFARLTYSGTDGALTAELRTMAEAKLPGVTATIRVRYTELVWDGEDAAHVPAGEATEHVVESAPVDTLRGASPYSLRLPPPPRAGMWQVDFSAETEPEIHLLLAGAQDVLAYDPEATDYLVAVTDQASGRILVLDPAVADWSDPAALRWSWSPKDVNGITLGWGLPSGVKLRRSEVWGGEWMLVVDSRGLAAIVPYPAGDSYKWFRVIDGNLHSAELLPDGNIALAASTGGWVRIYTSSQGPASDYYVEYPLPGAHGVLWDPTLELLWAVGDHELVGLRVLGTPDRPLLEPVVRSPLPTPWGHDLSPVYGDPDRLWVSTNTRVYQYIKSTGTWTTEFAGGRRTNLPYVKGVGNQPSGRVVLTQQKEGTLYTWTTDTVTLLNPSDTRTIPGAAIYKARVWSPEYQ